MGIRKSLRGVFGLDTALYVLLLLAASFSAWSAYRYAELQESFAKTAYDLSHAQVGDWLPQMALPILQDPNSTANIAAPANEGQVLYFFSPACKFCQASQPYAEGLYELIVQQGNMEMFAVSVSDEESTQKYLAETGSQIPTVVLPGQREISLYRIDSVPIMFNVDRDGKVIYAHYGVLTAKDAPSPKPSAGQPKEDRPDERS